MENFELAFKNLTSLVSQNYIYVLTIFVLSSGLFAFMLTILVGEKINILYYKHRIKVTRKKINEKKFGDLDQILKKIPTAPTQIKISGGILYLIAGVVLGVIFGILANDFLITPVVFLSMVGIGYSYFRGQYSGDFVKNKTQFIEILRIFSSNLETYQSVQRSFDELWTFYKKIDKEQRDGEFEKKLKTLIDLMPQGDQIEVLTDNLFGTHPIYQNLSRIVSVAVTSGISDAVEYSNNLIIKISRWKELVTMMNSQVVSLKFAASLLEVLFILAVFATLLPDWGDKFNNVLRMYFFNPVTGQKMFFAGVLIAHTIVQIGFIEFIKVQSESI